MMKKDFNHLDPFMPIKLATSKQLSGIPDMKNDEVFENFTPNALNENLRFGTPEIKSGVTVLLTRKAIGNENGLGEKLLVDFIYSLSNSFELPQYLIFMNEAVLLLNIEIIKNSLAQLKKYGVKILISVESLKCFNCDTNIKYVTQATSGDITSKILFSKRLISL